MLFALREAARLGARLTTQLVWRCACEDDTALGQRIGKQFKFVATGEWIRGLAIGRKCPCPKGKDGKAKHVKLTKQFILKAIKNKPKKVGQVRFNGIKHLLRKSGSYPGAAWQGHGQRKQGNAG